MLSEIRVGKITSSSIYKLMLKGRGDKPSVRTLEYLEEIRIERRLGRALNSAVSSRPMDWGHVAEARVASLLDEFEYEYVSDQTITHPQIADWCGTPDLIGADKVGDIKCPYTLKSFAQLVDSLNAGTLKTTHPEYFWQLVSNAILTDKNRAELIVYCPYQEELDEIRDILDNLDDTDLQTQFAWIKFNPDDKLPYLIHGGTYQNLNRAVFDVTDEDKQTLTEAVKKAVENLKD